MNWRRIPRLISVFTCCWLVGCEGARREQMVAQDEKAQSPASTEQRREKNDEDSSRRAIQSGISVQIELGDSPEKATLNFNEPIDIVITNLTDQPLSIWSPGFRNGWHQLSFTFVNVQSGVRHTVRKQLYDTRHYPAGLYPYEEPEPIVIEIPPHESYTIQVTFNQGLWGGSGWTGLPNPLSPDQFSVTVQFDSEESPSQKDYEVWTGKKISEAVVVRVADPSVVTVHDALEKGYVDLAIQMMEDKPSLINQGGPNRRTPLHVAAWFGHLEAARWLLEHGADVNAADSNQLTPVRLAVDPDVVRLLLQKKPDLTIAIHGVTPLQYAAEKLAQTAGTDEEENWRDIVKLYLDAGAEVNFTTAIYLDDLARVKTLLEASPKLAVDGLQHRTPLRFAASLGRFEICKYLIDEYHVDVDDFERGNGYPIVKDALPYPKIVELLISHGADLKKRLTWQGMYSGVHIIGGDPTALHFAVRDGAPDTIRLLIDNGVDIFSVTNPLGGGDYSKNTALEVAAYCGAAENAAAIINHPKFADADPTVRQAELDHCLLIAACSPFVRWEPDRLKFINLLLEKGANPNATENPDSSQYKNGITVMEAAVHAIDPVEKKKNSIIKAIADSLTAHGGKMDLASAVALGRIEDVKRLLKDNADSVNARRPDGYPALHVAIEMNHKAIVELLLKAGCNVDIRNQAKYIDGPEETALHCAAFWGRPEIASMLIEVGADVNAKDAHGNTPLHEAARIGNIKMTRLLLEHGADSDAKNENDNTPLDSCCQVPPLSTKEKAKCVKEIEAMFQEHRPRPGK